MKTIKVLPLLLLLPMFASSLLHSSYAVLPPDSVKGYIATSDIIVVGTIGKTIRAHTFYGYQESAAELARIDQTSSLNLGVPMVDYEIVVEEIIHADDNFYRDTDKPLIVRIQRSHDLLDTIEEQEDKGKFVMFLSLNPDQETYGFHSMGHKVNIDEQSRPKYYFVGEALDILDGNISSDDFLEEVRQAVR